MTELVDDSSGLGILELLVALAITSLLAIVVGWLLMAATNLNATGARMANIDLALARIAAMAGNLGHSAATAVIGGSGNDIDLVYAVPGIPSYSAKLKLADPRSENVRLLEASGPTLPYGNVELSIFDVADFEVFPLGGTTWLRIADMKSGQPISGLRLSVTAMSRVWYPILWSSSLVGKAPAP